MDEDTSQTLLAHTNLQKIYGDAMSTPNLYQRILKVMEAVPYVQKDATVQAGAGRSYKGVTHDAVISKLRVAMIKHGIVMTVQQTSEACVEGQTKGGAPKLRYEAWYTITLINADDPSERESYPIHAHAEDSGDKAPGKAVSYAVKMALLKAFALETGENDESRYQPEEVTYITDEQAADLEALIEEVGADRTKFLRYFKVASPAEIPASRYAAAVKALESKRQKEGAA